MKVVNSKKCYGFKKCSGKVKSVMDVNNVKQLELKKNIKKIRLI